MEKAIQPDQSGTLNHDAKNHPQDKINQTKNLTTLTIPITHHPPFSVKITNHPRQTLPQLKIAKKALAKTHHPLHNRLGIENHQHLKNPPESKTAINLSLKIKISNLIK